MDREERERVRKQVEERANDVIRSNMLPASAIETIEAAEAARMLAMALTNAATGLAREYDHRRREIMAAQAESHPWVGRAVKRTISQRKSGGMWLRGPTEYIEKTERGTIAQMGPERKGFRNYRPDPGEAFVISKSGLTAYSLNGGGWELDE